MALVGSTLFHLRSIKMRPVQLNLIGLHEKPVHVMHFWLDIHNSFNSARVHFDIFWSLMGKNEANIHEPFGWSKLVKSVI